MLEAYEVKPGVYILPSSFPLGPMGTLPFNAFLVKGRSPYLVDTGAVLDREAFIMTVESLIDPQDLRAIVLTHTDPDHIGALHPLLTRAPRAKLITNFVSSAKLEVMGAPVRADRLHLVNAGERLELDDEIRLDALKPAIFDAPETLAFYDEEHDVLFSSDSFGAPLSSIPPFASDIPPEELSAKEAVWASLDSPWIHNIDRRRYGAILEQIANLNPRWVLSSHLPPAKDMIRTLCGNLSKVPDSEPVHLPSQHEFEEMMAVAAASASGTPLGSEPGQPAV